MMDVDKLKEYASFIKDTFLTGKKTTLEIFYQESDDCRLLPMENVDINNETTYTPFYAHSDKEGLYFRGFIHTSDVGSLTIVIECTFETDVQYTIVEWSVSIYNTCKDEYLLLGESKMYVSSNALMVRSKIQVAISIIETHMQGNPLVFKWNVQTIFTSNCSSEFRNIESTSSKVTPFEVTMSSRDVNDQQDSKGRNIGIDNSIDELMQYLSSKEFKDDFQNQQELRNVDKKLETCQSKQKDNEEKLQIIQQRCIHINERLSQLLEIMDMQEQHVARYIANVSIQISNLQNTSSMNTIQFFNDNALSPELDRKAKLQPLKSDAVPYETGSSRKSYPFEIETPQDIKLKTCHTKQSSQPHNLQIIAKDITASTDTFAQKISKTDHKKTIMIVGRSGKGTSSLAKSISGLHTCKTYNIEKEDQTFEPYLQVNQYDGTRFNVLEFSCIGDTTEEAGYEFDTINLVAEKTIKIGDNLGGIDALIFAMTFLTKDTKRESEAVGVVKRIFGENVFSKRGIIVFSYDTLAVGTKMKPKDKFAVWRGLQQGIIKRLLNEVNERYVLLDYKGIADNESLKQLETFIEDIREANKNEEYRIQVMHSFTSETTEYVEKTVKITEKPYETPEKSEKNPEKIPEISDKIPEKSDKILEQPEIILLIQEKMQKKTKRIEKKTAKTSRRSKTWCSCISANYDD